MRIVGSFTPNSAAAERVFSLLKLMFGDRQETALADYLQAALMLRYNERKVGCEVGAPGVAQHATINSLSLSRLLMVWPVRIGVCTATGVGPQRAGGQRARLPIWSENFRKISCAYAHS
eukprot:6489737-Prymnesium_polylepis.1